MQKPDISGWGALLFLAITVGIPMGLWHWLQRPRAMLEWYRQGCGYPSPVQIEAQQKEDSG